VDNLPFPQPHNNLAAPARATGARARLPVSPPISPDFFVMKKANFADRIIKKIKF
jgi:hypothetical protein